MVVTQSSLVSCSFFLYFSLITLLFIRATYLMPILDPETKPDYRAPISTKKSDPANSSTGTDFSCHYFYLLQYLLVIPAAILHLDGPKSSAWFGHLLIGEDQFLSWTVIIISFIFIVQSVFFNTTYTKNEVYDYLIVTFLFCYWTSFIFFINSIYALLFLIEVLAALVLFLILANPLISESLKMEYDHTLGTPVTRELAKPFVYSVIYFFWINVLTSFNLWLFLTLYYKKFVTLDWRVLEHTFEIFFKNSSQNEIIAASIVWIFMIFSIFLKCGLAPFFLWKPIFFKGLSINTLYFYITFYYFWVFIYFGFVSNIFFSELFYCYYVANFTFIIGGILILLVVLCESFYVKSFLALSSILNSLFVFIALTSLHNVNCEFWL